MYKIKFPTRNPLNACLYLLQEWSLGALKICLFWNNALEGKSTFTLVLNTVKVLVISKNASNKGCLKWNFLRKTRWKHICIFPSSILTLVSNGKCSLYMTVDHVVISLFVVQYLAFWEWLLVSIVHCGNIVAFQWNWN